MHEMQILPVESIGRQFIPPEYLPRGKDEFHLRNRQCPRPLEQWRHLMAEEIETLVKNANTADSWENILVTDQFTPHSIKNCEFYGLVRIGRLEEVQLQYHDLAVPVGITNSRIISCDFGDDVAVHNVRYLAHYITGDNVILLNIDEMHTTNHAKFGNGIVKDGEEEEVRIWLELINEAGGRGVMPFDGMTPGDAYLWAKFRDDAKLMDRLGAITQRQFDPRRGFYGTVGDRCVIKNCRIIKDVKFGPCAYVKGANKLKNLTINSSEEEPSQIGEGVELVNGIIGYGCHVFYGCKAVRFVLGDRSNLKYGARLIHSYLGDNSTISCCEVLNGLIFPAHEQHHNNSFLIAALVKGQSNIAACATIGSNHNSRAPDGEIEAGRGFWPGLCVSVKHFCRFASFTLLAKGDYPAEMDVPLPFSLVSNDTARDRLLVMPAYWWLYNMYALARNDWKFHARDRRRRKVQKVEFDCLAPDTVEEIFAARELLEQWTAKAALRAAPGRGGPLRARSAAAIARAGRKLLTGPAEAMDGLEVLAENVEHSSRKVVILKPREAHAAYGQMLRYYAVKNLLAYVAENRRTTLAGMSRALGGSGRSGRGITRWVNLGGQLIPEDQVRRLRADINAGRLDSWAAIHERYDALWAAYPRQKRRHAFAMLLEALGERRLTRAVWRQALDEALAIQRYICEQTYLTRKKDYDNRFRQMTFATAAELEAVMGDAEHVSFVKQVRGETKAFERQVRSAKRMK
jgi:hypothetical protein